MVCGWVSVLFKALIKVERAEQRVTPFLGHGILNPHSTLLWQVGLRFYRILHGA